MINEKLIPFKPGLANWPDPDLSIIGDDLPEAPPFPRGLITARWARFLDQAARCTSSPVDFAGSTLLAATGAISDPTSWLVR